MYKERPNFGMKLRRSILKIIANYHLHAWKIVFYGTPDLLGYNNSSVFFTVELKLKKAKKIVFSPHQISFHVRHPKNTFILVKELPKALGQRAVKLYEGTEIHALVGGTHPTPVACGLSACCLFLERL